MQFPSPKLAEFLRRVDALCAGLNDGLTAVAIVLAIGVACAGMVRAAEITNNLMPVSLDDGNPPVFNAWTYN